MSLNATVTSITSLNTTSQLKAASDRSRGVAIYNNSTSILYLRFGTADATATDFTIQLAAETYYEVPFAYRGEIQGIWATANGAALVTDFY